MWCTKRAGQALWICQGHPIKQSSNPPGSTPGKLLQSTSSHSKKRGQGSPYSAFDHKGTRESSTWVLPGLSSPSPNPTHKPTPGASCIYGAARLDTCWSLWSSYDLLGLETRPLDNCIADCDFMHGLPFHLRFSFPFSKRFMNAPCNVNLTGSR